MNNAESRRVVGGTFAGGYGLSAVAWGAVFAGAVVAAGLSLLLMVGGAGLGFVAMSPWEAEGAPAVAIGIGAIIWLFVTQIIAYGVAGYLTGRLRKSWAPGYSDETYFRDSAHGLIVWALSALISAFVVGSAMTSIATGAAKAAGQTLSGAGQAVSEAGSGMLSGAMASDSGGEGLSGYFVDSLFRSTDPAAQQSPQEARQEATRIVVMSVGRGELSQEDKSHLSRLIARHAGITEEEAGQRIDAVITRMQDAAKEAETAVKEAADATRKAAAGFALWAFAALLVGAFVSTYMAIVGGRHAREP